MGLFRITAFVGFIGSSAFAQSDADHNARMIQAISDGLTVFCPNALHDQIAMEACVSRLTNISFLVVACGSAYSDDEERLTCYDNLRSGWIEANRPGRE